MAINSRTLELRSLDDAVADANQLLTNGYRQTGNWDLAQTLGHCTDWLRFPMVGYPPANFPINLILNAMRITIGKAAFRKILRERGFKTGSPTMPATVKPKHGKTDAEALREFSEIVQQFKQFRSPLFPSPLFGQLSYEQHREIQVIHLQHHLQNLIPNREGIS